MQYELVIKSGVRTRTRIKGLPKEEKSLSIEQLRENRKKIYEVEEFLEKLIGLRFHINEIGEIHAGRS